MESEVIVRSFLLVYIVMSLVIMAVITFTTIFPSRGDEEFLRDIDYYRRDA